MMQYFFNDDSNLYGHDTGDKPFTLPVKTKQIGSIEGQMKIFMEDYVYTYLYQYGKSGGGKEKLAVLVGKHYVVEGEEILIISGAIQGKETIQQNGVECFSDATWEYVGSQMETYFKGLMVLGWVHCQPGFGAFLMSRDEGFHREYFKEKWQVLFVLDSIDKLDTFYIYNKEKNRMKQAKGYFIYYDKNKEMQEYMLENSMIRPRETAKAAEDEEEAKGEEQERGRRKPTQEERMDAAKEIRRVLQKRAQEAETAQKSRYALLTGISCVLCVVCLCMGFAVMSSMDRLKDLETELVAVQSSYHTLAEDMEGAKAQAVFAAEKNAAAAVQTKEEHTEEAVQGKGEQKTYRVESGDSLGYISRKFYGDNSGIGKIMEANGLSNPDMIYEGQALLLP